MAYRTYVSIDVFGVHHPDLPWKQSINIGSWTKYDFGVLLQNWTDLSTSDPTNFLFLAKLFKGKFSTTIAQTNETKEQNEINKFTKTGNCLKKTRKSNE